MGTVETERFERFWAGLLQLANQRTNLHQRVKPSRRYDLVSPAQNGITFRYAIIQDLNKRPENRNPEARAEVYIDMGKGKDRETLTLFRRLEEAKHIIERSFGGHFVWESLPPSRACRIKCVLPLCNFEDGNCWRELQESMVDAMVRLEKAFRSHLLELKSQ